MDGEQGLDRVNDGPVRNNFFKPLFRVISEFS